MMSNQHGIFAIPETTEGKEALAREAVKEFRKLQPTLNAYARLLTGNKKMRVEISSSSNGSSNGERIFYRPPLELGLKPRHNRSLCDKRSSDLQLSCPACRIRERVLVVIYHEIAHLAFGTFDEVKDSDLAEITKEGVKSTEGKFAEAILKRIDSAAYYYKNRYMPLANLISEWLPIVLNAIEDARVDARMFKTRPGTKIMFDAKVNLVFSEGVDNKDPVTGEIVKVMWCDQPLNMQAIIGVFCLASGYYIDDWFDEKVVNDLKDPKLLKLIGKIKGLSSSSGSYRLSFPILARLRELGYCLLPEDPEVPEEPPPSEEQDDDSEDQEDGGETPEGDDVGEGGSPDDDEEDGESESSSDSGDGDAQSEGDSSDETEASEGSSGGESSSNSDGEAGSGDDAGGDPGEDGEGSKPESSDAEHGGTDGAGSPERPEADGEQNDDDDSGDSEDGSGSDGSSRGPDERVGDSPDDNHDEHGSEAGSSSGDRDDDEADWGGDDADEAAGPNAGSGLEDQGQTGDDDSEPLEQDDSDQSGTEDADPESGDTDSGSSADADGVSDAGDDASSGGDGDSSTGERGPDAEGDAAPEGTDQPGNDPADSDDEGETSPSEEDEVNFPEAEEGEEALDTGADLGKGGATVDEAAERELPYGTPEEGKAALLSFGDHEPPQIQGGQDEQAEEDVEKAFAKAIVQGLYFETPSHGVATVREHYWDNHATDKRGVDISTGWNHNSRTNRYSGYSRVESGIEGDFEPTPHILQQALLKLRKAFADNARGGQTRHRNSGRVDRSVLGKRAGLGDPRLFYTKTKVEKRSYFVVIGIDISGSTVGLNLKLAKRAALAQAVLLSRLGIPFAVYAHTANIWDTEDWSAGFALEIYHIKDPHEPWTDKTKERLTSLGPCEGNLDGHSIEYYRKVAMKQQATDRIVMYYTDGEMPAANYDEELEVLQDQVKRSKRDDLTLMGVGIRTDSPIKHGLDTVSVEGDADIIKVITHLEKRLTTR